jgi:GT2 family glycosyltransferase
MNKIIIKVGIPSFTGKFFPDLLKTKEAFKKAPQELGIIWDEISGYHSYCIHTARNKVVYGSDKFVPNFNPPYHYLLFIDDDNGLSLDGLLKLLKIAQDNNDNCIVSAAYPERHGDKDRLVAGSINYETGGNTEILIEEFKNWPEEKFPVEVEMVGLGSCLIPEKILKALPAPIFQHEYLELPNSLNHEQVFMYEDQSFCRAVRKAGFKVLLSNVLSSHRGIKIK